MSPPGRPKGEYRSAQREGTPISGADNALPPRPVPPRPDECCGAGCPRCVYELYDEAVAEWERLVAERAKTLADDAPDPSG
jgi:Oxidoreductase-like protein, N-terminal